MVTPVGVRTLTLTISSASGSGSIGRLCVLTYTLDGVLILLTFDGNNADDTDAADDDDDDEVVPWESCMGVFVIEEGGENRLFNKLFFLSMDSLSAVFGLPGGSGS